MTLTTGSQRGRVAADTLAHRVLLLRVEVGLSQRDAAAKCGLTFGEWQSIEAGRKARGLDEKIRKISAAFGYDRDWLMWGREDTGNGDTPAAWPPGQAEDPSAGSAAQPELPEQDTLRGKGSAPRSPGSRVRKPGWFPSTAAAA